MEDLGVSNLPSWKVRTKMHLIRKDLYDIVEDGVVDIKDKDQVKKDRKALAEVGLLIEAFHLTTVDKVTSAKELWESFENLFKAQTTARLMLLRRQMTNLKKEPTEPLPMYIAKAQSI